MYLQDADVDNGQSEPLHQKLTHVITAVFGVSMFKAFALGSDSAAAMIGCRNSVSALLRGNNSLLIKCHSAGHKCKFLC